MDFMSDTLSDGRSIRTFNVIDDYNREGLGIDVDLSLPSSRVIRSLEQIIDMLDGKVHWHDRRLIYAIDTYTISSLTNT